MRHSANLDMLRTLAVSAVLADHLMATIERHSGFPHPLFILMVRNVGHAGVLAFFVHTSLVLMDSLERMHAHTDRVAWRFYLRRIFRIYPLAIFSIALALAFHIPNVAWDIPTRPTAAIVLANLLLVQNLLTRHDVLQPMWSLPYEVQMYLVLPALWLLARRPRGVQGLAALLLASALAGTLVGWRLGHLSLLSYVPCFLCGVLCYALRSRQSAVLPPWLWPCFVFALFLASMAANLHFPAPWHTPQPAFWIGWLFCLVLGLGINVFRDQTSPLLNIPAQRIAQYSYGMYLLHVPVLALVFLHWRITQPAPATALYLALTTAASVATYHLLEGPLIQLGRRWSEPGPAAAPSPTASRRA